MAHLFLEVCVSLCKEEAVGTENGDLRCGEPGECGGAAQGTVEVGRGHACGAADMPVLLSSGGRYLGLASLSTSRANG